jgi:hypothetical protein
VPGYELILRELHFCGRESGRAPALNAKKMRARVGSVNSAKSSREGQFFRARGHALFDFSVKIIFSAARNFFVRFFLSVFRAISSLKPCGRAKRQMM